MARMDVIGSEAKRAAMKVERFAISETLAMTTDEIKTLTRNCINTLTSQEAPAFTIDMPGAKIRSTYGKL